MYVSTTWTKSNETTLPKMGFHSVRARGFLGNVLQHVNSAGSLTTGAGLIQQLERGGWFWTQLAPPSPPLRQSQVFLEIDVF